MPWLTLLSALPLTLSVWKANTELSNENIYVTLLYHSLDRFLECGEPLGAEQKLDGSPAEGFAGTSYGILNEAYDLLKRILDSKRFVEVGIPSYLIERCDATCLKLKSVIDPFLEALRKDADSHSWRTLIIQSQQTPGTERKIFLVRYATHFRAFAECVESIVQLLDLLHATHPQVKAVKSNRNWKKRASELHPPQMI